MFCILYKLFDNTGMKFFENEKCFSECKYFKNDKCSIIIKQNEKMSDQRFGWMIEEGICFPEPLTAKHANTFYCSFLLFIHPIEKDFWISKCMRKNKETIFYSVYKTNKRQDFNDLKALNYWLVQNRYDGRILVESDFI